MQTLRASRSKVETTRNILIHAIIDCASAVSTPENHLHNCMLSCRTLPESAKKSGAVYVNSCGGGVGVDFATGKRVQRMKWRARKAADRHVHPAKVYQDRKNRSEMRVSETQEVHTSDKRRHVGREWEVRRAAFFVSSLFVCSFSEKK